MNANSIAENIIKVLDVYVCKFIYIQKYFDDDT